jgi:hypothetical protein
LKGAGIVVFVVFKKGIAEVFQIGIAYLVLAAIGVIEVKRVAPAW